MVQFHETGMGKKYYMKDLPQLVEILGRIANSLEDIHQHLERQSEAEMEK